ncbi:MAG: hypothetical protein ABJE95_15760 [Byssovorax sp.]
MNRRALVPLFAAMAAAAAVSLLPSPALADDWASNPCNSDDAQGAVITYLTGRTDTTAASFNFVTSKASTFTFGHPFSAFVVATQPTVAVSIPYTASKAATFTITAHPVGGTHPSVMMLVCEYWRNKDDPPNQSWSSFRSVSLVASKLLDTLITPTEAGTTKKLDLSPKPPSSKLDTQSRVLLVLMRSRGAAQAMKLDLDVEFKK